MRHFIAVNRIGSQEAETCLQEAYQQQQKFDQKRWTINYGDYNCYMPALASKQQRQKHARFLRPRSKSSYSPDSNLDASYF